MSFLGMAPDQVRGHADRVTDASQRMAELQQRLDAITRGVEWVGPDRDSFLEQWASGASAGMLRMEGELSGRGDQLRQEADEQDRVSDSDGGLAGGPGGIGDLIGDLIGGIGDVIGGIGEGIGDFAERVGEAVIGIGGAIGDAIGQAGEALEDAGDWLGDKLGDAKDWLGDRFEDAKDWVGDRVEDAKDWVGERIDDVKDWFVDKYGQHVGDPDRPFAEIAAEKLVDELIAHDQLQHRPEVEVLGSREIVGETPPNSLEDLILDNDETRRTIDGSQPPREYDPTNEAQIRIQQVTGADGVDRYVVHVPPTQGAPLRQNMEILGQQTSIPDPGKTIEGWNEQGQPFGWDNNLYAMAGKENAGANAVKAAMEEAGIPPGSEVAFVAHSQGGLVASQLADDPSFNGGENGYRVTDIFSVGSPVETYTPSNGSTDVLNVHHTEGGGRDGDFVPGLDLEGRSLSNPGGNPAPNVNDVQFETPAASPGYNADSGAQLAHDSVIWNDDHSSHDPDSGYYGTVRNNADHEAIAAKDERMSGRYYGDGTTVQQDVVVDVRRKDS